MILDSVAALAALSTADLERRLERLFDAEPRLRPRAEEHDYQLTYPPAVAVEKPLYARSPTDPELRELGLGALDGVAFYFHFGFCAYRCRYCFHYELKTRRDDALMARYVDALALELDRAKALVGAKRNLLYFLGGGTPTALPTALLERFLDRLVSTLGRPPTALSTVEAKPVTATDDKLRALVAAGFRRINLGVQTLDPELYAYHHHGEDLRVAQSAIERARKAGFDYVNIDVMTGLERQSAASWDTTLQGLERLCRSGAVDSVFIYPYHDDPRSKTYGTTGLVPSFAETAATDAKARALFERLGFSELGVRFYRSRRHVARELLELARVRRSPTYGEVLYHGLGNSSFSVGDRATYLNHRDVGTYCEAVEAGRSANLPLRPPDRRSARRARRHVRPALQPHHARALARSEVRRRRDAAPPRALPAVGRARPRDGEPPVRDLHAHAARQARTPADARRALPPRRSRGAGAGDARAGGARAALPRLLSAGNSRRKGAAID
ncbi:MAG: radical SAM protein [Myxococcales bacterium]|nr:radical SAM protein [Myxococcales bacterium]